MRHIMRALFPVIIAAVFSGTGDLPAQPREAGEYAVKAAYLYNFTKFVEWPDSSLQSSDVDITVCVLGDDPFGDALSDIRGKVVGKRTVAIRHIVGIKQIRSCQVLFISDSEADRLEPALDAARTAHVLTVSDIPQFGRSGGMIALFTDQDRVRFTINEGAAKQAGLKISSHLLKLATVVIE